MKRILSITLALILSLLLCVPAMAASEFQKVNSYVPGQFADVPADSWCADNVKVA